VGSVGLLSVTALTACSAGAGSSTPSARVIVDATRSNSARFETVTHVSESRSGPRITLEASGVVDFANGRGESTVTESDPSSTTPTSTPTPATGGVVTKARWIGDRAFSSGATSLLAPRSTKLWTLIDEARVHAAFPCVPAKSEESASGAAEDPSTVLSTLRDRGLTFTRVGTGAVRGVSTTHLHSAPTTSVPKACPTSRRPAPSVKTTIDVWIDNSNRARRIHGLMTVSTPAYATDPGLPTATSFTVPAGTETLDSTTEFFDFGTSVDVQAPPADQTYDETDAFLAQLRGPGTVAADGWHVVARGRLGRGPWTVFSARTTTGWLCYDAPGTGQGAVGAITSSNGFPKHGKDASQCSIPGTAAFFGVFNAFINTIDGGRRIIVGVTTTPGAATITFTDGTSQRLTVDPATSLVNWSRPSTGPAPLRIIVDGTSCRLDGLGGDPFRESSAPPPTGSKVSPDDVQCGGENPSSPFAPAIGGPKP
jgi:hypothetical protein